MLKEAVRKMGPNVSLHAVNRAAKMTKLAAGTVDEIARECQIINEEIWQTFYQVYKERYA